MNLSQSTGWSALFFAAENEDVATTKLLLKAGANPLLKDYVSLRHIECIMICRCVTECMCVTPFRTI